MNILVFADYDGIGKAVAEIVKKQVELKPTSVLGLATGSTPIGLYKQLAVLHDEGLDFSHVTTFNLDEYIGLAKDHPASYYRFMQENLFSKINVKPEKIHIPNGMAEDIDAECNQYEQSILLAHGIDLQILGIGHNGHIGFNEPGTEFGNLTQPIKLTESTIKANARFFDSSEQVPKQAISMGIKTIMKSRKILLLASGQDKAQAVKEAVEGPVTKDMPASILQLHPDVTFVLDKAAAAKLS